MNWGTKITVLYLSFVALILVLVFTCFGQKSELESKDYFAKELQFQKQIDATDNANALKEPIEHIVKGKTVSIQLPLEIVTPNLNGTIEFVRPSDASQDKIVKLNVNNEGQQLIENVPFIKGVYKMKISLISNGKSYFKENVVYFE